MGLNLWGLNTLSIDSQVLFLSFSGVRYLQSLLDQSDAPFNERWLDTQVFNVEGGPDEHDRKTFGQFLLTKLEQGRILQVVYKNEMHFGGERHAPVVLDDETDPGSADLLMSLVGREAPDHPAYANDRYAGVRRLHDDEAVWLRSIAHFFLHCGGYKIR